MRTGLYVIMVFAALWGGLALATLGAPGWTWAGPAAVSALVLVFKAPRVPSSSDRAPGDGRRVGRLVAFWSGLEVAAMLVAVNVLPATGHARLVNPAATLIVALHFLPLARGLPFRLYYATGAAMIVTSLAAFLLPGSWPQTASAAAAALVLWATAFGFPERPSQPADA